MSALSTVFADGRCLVVAGCCGNVGFGKLGQFARLLSKQGIPVIGLDLSPDVQAVPDRLREEFGRKFDADAIDKILANVTVIQGGVADVETPIGMVFEAIPERLELKRGFYAQIREQAPEALIFSATSGFTTQKLFAGLPGGERCGVLHPFFPHLTNKLFELPTGGVTSPETQSVAQSLLGELGLITLEVSDVPAFAADRVFCMMMTEAVRVHVDHGLPAGVIDMALLQLLGSRPFLVHNMIQGANTLTVSCIDELADESESSFYKVPDAFREKADDPSLKWEMGERRKPTAEETKIVEERVIGALLCIGSLILDEGISPAADLNLMCEDALAFKKGIPALARNMGLDKARALCEGYLASQSVTHADQVARPAVFSAERASALDGLYIRTMESPEAADCMLITLGRAAINHVYVEEFGQALDALEASDATCAVVIADGRSNQEFGRGADVSEFVPALGDEAKARELSLAWKHVFARIPKLSKPVVAALSRRSLGGSNELASLCTARVAVAGTTIGQPEPTVGVVPGLGGCTTLLRFSKPEARPEVASLLLTGDPIDAAKAQELGLVSEVCSPSELVGKATALARGIADGSLERPDFEAGSFALEIPADVPMQTGHGIALDPTYRALLQETIEGCAARSFDDAMAYESDQAGKAFLLPAAAIGVKALLSGKRPDFSQAAQ